MKVKIHFPVPHPHTGQDTAPSVNALRHRSPTIKRLRNQRRSLTLEVFSLRDASHCLKNSFIFICKIGFMDDGKCFYKSKANIQKQFRPIFWLKGPNPRNETYIFTSNTGSQKTVNLRKFEFKNGIYVRDKEFTKYWCKSQPSATFVYFWSEFMLEMA